MDPVVGDAVPTADGAEASVWCFAFGSNMKRSVLEGRRMIKPAESVPAVLAGWQLTFNQPGLPYREPGFASVEKIAPADGARVQDVHGVAHRMTPHEWEYYKESEGAAGQSDQGYGVVEVEVELYDGRTIPAYTLQTQPKTVARLKGRKALPSLRYLTLLRDGAEEHGLSDAYKAYLAGLAHYQVVGAGAKLGAVLTQCIAYGLLFPMFGTMRMYRKLRGLKSVDPTSRLARLQNAYFHFVFGMAWGLHDLLEPLLGSGCGTPSHGSTLKAA